MTIEILKYVCVIFVGYTLGNINFARILSKFLKTDITKQGSGNPGTMNMLRTFGFKFGLLTLVLDAFKSSLASLYGFFVFGGDMNAMTSVIGLYIGGLSCVVGHNFPVFYHFKGGKGVACTLGMFAVANPMWSLVAFAISFVYLCIFDYGAVASFIFITVLTVLEATKYRANFPMTCILFVVFFLTWFMHRKNIARLLWGKENRVNLTKAFKKKPNKISKND
jgi:acyl phosphate:glycerol-3-phosphate acyltransferase